MSYVAASRRLPSISESGGCRACELRRLELRRLKTSTVEITIRAIAFFRWTPRTACLIISIVRTCHAASLVNLRLLSALLLHCKSPDLVVQRQNRVTHRASCRGVLLQVFVCRSSRASVGST